MRITYKIHVTVHVYAEDRLFDGILTRHSWEYGIHGKRIIVPLRRINNKLFKFLTTDSFTVRELWDKINGYLTRWNRINREFEIFSVNRNLL